MNLYQYCGNNPVNFVDPIGLYSNPLDILEEAFEKDFPGIRKKINERNEEVECKNKLYKEEFDKTRLPLAKQTSLFEFANIFQSAYSDAILGGAQRFSWNQAWKNVYVKKISTGNYYVGGFNKGFEKLAIGVRVVGKSMTVASAYGTIADFVVGIYSYFKSEYRYDKGEY